MLTGLEDIGRAYEVGAPDFAITPDESQSWLAPAQRVAHLGHWEWDSRTFEWILRGKPTTSGAIAAQGSVGADGATQTSGQHKE